MSLDIDVSICIVNWNTKKYLDRCLHSLSTISDSIITETIVVDNASSDGSSEWVKTHFPQVHLIENNQNVGFASANNQAFRLAKGKWIYILNPDTEILPGSMEALLSFLKTDANTAMVAPQLLNSDGSVQSSVRRFPGFRIALYRYTLCKKLGLFSRLEADNKMRDCRLDQPLSVEQPAGAALLIRKDILEALGGMDPRFFLFYEEVDLCRRIKTRGYDIYYCPQAQVVHHQGKSRQKNRQQIFLPTLRSLFYYLQKHKGTKKTYWFKWYFKPLFIITTLWDILEETISYRIYVMKKEGYRAQRKKERVYLKTSFLKYDLKKFIYDL